MPLYNRSDAVRYATKYALVWNPSFRDFNNMDCTNFVSQCLFAGGWPMMEWPLNWWSTDSESSKAWASASLFGKYMQEYRIAVECKREELAPGDILTNAKPGNDFNHFMFVTGIGGGSKRDVFYSAHSYKKLNYSLAMIQDENPGLPFRYWKVSDVVRTLGTGTFTRTLENVVIQGRR